MIGILALSLMTQALGGGLLVVTGGLLVALGVHQRHAFARAGGLLLVLTGSFVVLVAVLNRADPQSSPMVSIAALGGAFAVFRLMARFEPSREEAKPPK